MAQQQSDLNPFDDSFDCLKALHSSLDDIQRALPTRRDVQIFKKAQPLNNIAACASLSTAPYRVLSQRPQPQPQPLPPAASAASASSAHKRARDGAESTAKSLAPRHGVLRQMHERQVLQHGPLSFLQRALSHKFRVRVVMRNRHAIRGVVSGHVVAFDRHMNLVLLQAVIRDTGRDARRCNQLFVRGENVVLVSYC